MANDLTDIVKRLTTTLKECDIIAGVSKQTESPSKKDYFHIIVSDVRPTQDINMVSVIHKELRKAIGYGSLEQNYDPNTKVLIVNYFIPRKEAPIETKKGPQYRAGGSTL